MTISVLANDSDPDTSDVLSVAIDSQPENGSAVLNADNMVRLRNLIALPYCRFCRQSAFSLVRSGSGTAPVCIFQSNVATDSRRKLEFRKDKAPATCGARLARSYQGSPTPTNSRHCT